MAAGLNTATATIDVQARVAALVGQHGNTLVRVARKYSLCADDAHDAFQRALEIYLRRLDSLDPVTEVAWMRVVVRNEALAVRRSRSQLVSGEEPDLDARADDAQRSLQERAESNERVIRSAEALRALKRDEAHALLLKAEGLSYGEIGEQLGWTYTKVNRCITEGRARFRRVFGGIESGEQCEAFSPLLASLAAGAADAADMARLRPHLRHCGGCRAEIRRLHGSRAAVAALLPLPAFIDRLRPTSLRADLYGVFGRLSGSEPVAGTLAAGGGGRSAGATALIGLCLAGASAGGYCAAGGPLPDATALGGALERSAHERRADPHPAAPTTPAAPAAVRAPAVPVAAGTAPSPPVPSQATTGTIVTPAEPAGDEFSFERTAKSSRAGERGGVAPEPAAGAEADTVPERQATPEPAPEPATFEQTTAAPAPAPTRSSAESTGGGGEFGFER